MKRIIKENTEIWRRRCSEMQRPNHHCNLLSKIMYYYYPLTPLFCTPRNNAEKKAWTLRFRQTFNITPIRFRQIEKKLKERCEKYSVTYIAPSLTDSVQAIKERKSLLHKKCQATAEKVRWKNMTVSDRNKRAANKKRQGELVYQQQCKASKTL